MPKQNPPQPAYKPRNATVPLSLITGDRGMSLRVNPSIVSPGFTSTEESMKIIPQKDDRHWEYFAPKTTVPLLLIDGGRSSVSVSPPIVSPSFARTRKRYGPEAKQTEWSVKTTTRLGSTRICSTSPLIILR